MFVFSQILFSFSCKISIAFRTQNQKLRWNALFERSINFAFTNDAHFPELPLFTRCVQNLVDHQKTSNELLFLSFNSFKSFSIFTEIMLKAWPPLNSWFKLWLQLFDVTYNHSVHFSFLGAVLYRVYLRVTHPRFWRNLTEIYRKV